jgi:hypothetical protein
MSSNREKFNNLVTICRDIEFQECSRVGTLRITGEGRLCLLNTLIHDDDFALKLISGGEPEVGKSISVEIGDPRISLGIVASNLDDLLVVPKARFQERKNYFVISEKFSSLDETAIVPEIIERYRIMLQFLDLIRKSSAYLDENKEEFIFIHNGKFTLPIVYTTEQLKEIDVAMITKLLESFENDTHHDQKLAIFSKSIQTISGSANPNERFTVLLSHLSDLQKSFSEGYKLFVADFSYEKIINQLEVAKLEEIGKIHKVFSDIQNQILGIPVATIVVATQMKSATAIGYEFWVNTAVLIGCWIFVLLSWFILRNQNHTLESISEEIDRKEKQAAEKYNSVKEIITQSFGLIKKRLKAQKNALRVVNIILGVGITLSHIVFLQLTKPAQEWIIALWNSFHS